MEKIITIAEETEKQALSIIDDLKIYEMWGLIGAEINLVGSLKTGLLVKNLDIDFHIYTKKFSIAESFGVMSKFAENPKVKEIVYKNLINSEDRCIEWHLYYEDAKKQLWQIDMIQILNDSPYVGYFEKVAERILEVLTEETREAILNIKYSIPDNEKVGGIKIYKAVIQDGIRTYAEFIEWNRECKEDGIITWMP
ncbi:MAG: nucleotidyltransferase domain-containing protein [Ignavibacteria bacterium]|jgi:hypothetical protein